MSNIALFGSWSPEPTHPSAAILRRMIDIIPQGFEFVFEPAPTQIPELQANWLRGAREHGVNSLLNRHGEHMPESYVVQWAPEGQLASYEVWQMTIPTEHLAEAEALIRSGALDEDLSIIDSIRTIDEGTVGSWQMDQLTAASDRLRAALASV